MFHLAQLNTARLRAPLDDPRTAGFTAFEPLGFRRRAEWLEPRLGYLELNGPTPNAFTFSKPFPVPDGLIAADGGIG